MLLNGAVADATSALIVYIIVQDHYHDGLRLLAEVGYDTAGLRRSQVGAPLSRVEEEGAITSLALGATTSGVLVAAYKIATSLIRHQPVVLSSSVANTGSSHSVEAASDNTAPISLPFAFNFSAAVKSMSKNDVRRSFPRVAEVQVDNGRTSKAVVRSAVSAARRAASTKATGAPRGVHAHPVAEMVASLANSAPDFEVFAGKKSSIASTFHACLLNAPPDFVSGLAEAIELRKNELGAPHLGITSSRHQTAPVAQLACDNGSPHQLQGTVIARPPSAATVALRSLRAMHPTIKESDCSSTTDPLTCKVPHVASVYTVILRLRANAVVLEVKYRTCNPHDRRSRQTGDELPVGFIVALCAAMQEAEVMVEAGRGDAFMDIVYIGQELRGDAKEHFVRFLAHFTTGGSPVLYELCSRTNDCYCVPLAQACTIPSASAAGGKATVDYGIRLCIRIISFLPPQAEMVTRLRLVWYSFSTG